MKQPLIGLAVGAVFTAVWMLLLRCRRRTPVVKLKGMTRKEFETMQRIRNEAWMEIEKRRGK